jgi:uncharacterized protein YjbI with pentapeptide repeats
MGVNLDGANLTRANLLHADLATASLRGATFEGSSLNETNLRGAFADESTIWPQGFDPAEANVIIGANRI